MKIINFRFFPIAVMFLTAGIVLAYYFWYDSVTLFIAIGIFSFSGVVVMIFGNKLHISPVCTVFYVFFIIGLILTVGRIHASVYGIKEETVVGEIRINNVEINNGEYMLDVDFTSETTSGKARLDANGYDIFSLGDKATALIYVKPMEIADENYKLNDYYFTRKEKYDGKILDVYKYENGGLNFIETIKLNIKDNLEVLGENQGIAYALLTGDKYLIDESTYDNYRVSGLAHVLAVSGLHVSIIAGGLIFLLKKLKVNRFVRLGTVGGALFLYAVFCEFTPSVTRAFIMTSVLLVADCSGDEKDFLSSITLSATIILLINQFNLFNVSFLLSYSAVLGIAMLYPQFKKLFRRIPVFFREFFAVSLAVNIFSFPVMAYYFKSVSLVFLLANILVLPAMSLGYMLLLMGAILSLITTLKFFVYPGGIFVSYMNFVAEKVAELPFASISVKGLGISAICLYFMFLAVSDFIMLKPKYKTVTASVSAVLFLSLAIFA